MGNPKNNTNSNGTNKGKNKPANASLAASASLPTATSDPDTPTLHFTQTISGLQTSITGLTSQLSDLSAFTATLAALETEYTSAQTALRNHQSVLDALEEERRKLSAAEDTYLRVQEHLHQEISARKELEKVLESTRAENTQRESDLTRKYESEITILKKKHESDVHTMTVEHIEMENKQKAEYNSMVDQYESTITDLKRTIAELSHKKTALEAIHVSQLDDIRGLKEDLHELGKKEKHSRMHLYGLQGKHDPRWSIERL